MLASDWYAERLKAKQAVDIQLWSRHVRSLKAFAAKSNYAEEAARLGVSDRLLYAQSTLDKARSSDYLKRLHETLGVQPLSATPT